LVHHQTLRFIWSMPRLPPRSPLFPYTTLFRSAPSRLRSRLSSKPIHTTHRSSLVNPANQPSRDVPVLPAAGRVNPFDRTPAPVRSEEHTSELQSRGHLVCRLLLEKKKTAILTA